MERLLLVYTPEYKELERASHRFAEEYSLPRYRPHEVFNCSIEDTPAFISKYRDFLEVYHASHIHAVVDVFDAIPAREAYIPLPVSNC